MNQNLLNKMIAGSVVTEDDLINVLYEICDDEHSSCNDNCPVYDANGDRCPGDDKPFSENRGCDCFKNGALMLQFLRSREGSV